MKSLQLMGLDKKIVPGMTIAIPVGSRGITDILAILKTAIEWIKSRGGKPFLVAAMGSHGGGTREGMLGVLRRLGITPDSMGTPISSSEDVVRVGRTSFGSNVCCATEAAGADGILVINRIKPHTAMRGEHESGLLKMLAVGLGRAPGAKEMHCFGPLEMSHNVQEASRVIIGKMNILGGIGLIENALGQTAAIRGFKREDMVEGDRQLLVKARELMPGLPVDDLDFLLVREMGKNYSGTGIDTNIIGRWCLDEFPDPPQPSIRRIAVLDLAPASQGNANGIGLADFTTAKLFYKIDFNSTYLNGLTTNFIKRVMLPIILPTDQAVFEKGIASLRLDRPEKARILIIHNTLHLDEMYISASLEEEVSGKDNIRIIQRNITPGFDGQGNLTLQTG
ncbi:MAG TPA: hypothetical protein VFD15_06505 [Clostridia bacterium]|nr:hypothetical protein [Clostridia bacterium]